MAGDLASAAAEEQRVASAEFYGLRCNFSDDRCKQCKENIKEAWVTNCSHVFCFRHAKEWFSNKETCPVCRNGHVKVVRFDLGAKKRERNAVLGMTPPELIQAAESALSFWVRQKVFQSHTADARNTGLDEHYKKTEETVKARLKEAESVCNKSENGNQQLQRMLKAAVDQNSKASEEVAGLERQLEEAESKFSNLQKAVSKNNEVFSDRVVNDPAPQMQHSAFPGRAGPEQARGNERNRVPDFFSDRRDFSGGSGSRVVAPAAPGKFGIHSDVGCASFLRPQSRPGSDSECTLSDMYGFSATPSGLHMQSLTPGVLGSGRLLKKRKIS